MALIALVLALVSCDELSESKRLLLDAIEGANDTKGAEAAAKIAAFDSKEALDILLKSHTQCVATVEEWERRKERLIKIMEEKGRDPKTGQYHDLNGFKKARDELTDVNGKVGRLGAIRTAIAQGLANFKSETTIEELLSRLKSGGDWAFRALLVTALAQIEHPEITSAFVAALKIEHEPAVRVVLCSALAVRKEAQGEIIELLCGLLRDDFWQVKCAAAGALAALGSLRAVDALIEALTGVDGRVRADFNAALVGLTKVDKHGSYDAWKAWWMANQEAVIGGVYKPNPNERPGASGGTMFYGIPVVSKKFAFVVDRSGSMAGKAKWKPEDATPTGPNVGPGIKLTGDRKIDVARYEMKKVLSMLPDGIEFTVVFYNREVEVGNDKLLALNKETRRRVFEYIDKVEPGGLTNISDGLERALDFATVAEKLSKSGIDTIYLLSDGYPTAGITDGGQLRARIVEVNRTRKVAIHTVAIEPDTNSAALMRALARENDGTYTQR